MPGNFNDPMGPPTGYIEGMGWDTTPYPDRLPDGEFSFSGTDFEAIYISQNEDGPVLSLKNLQTISVSTKTTMIPVRALGEKSPRDYARAHRTIAGTLVFILMGNDPFMHELANSMDHIKRRGMHEQRKLYIENIPKFDLLLRAVGEVPNTTDTYRIDRANTSLVNSSIYGNPAGLPNITQLYLRGLHLPESGMTLSVHDLYTEVMYTYVAEWVVPFASDLTLQHIRALIAPQYVGQTLENVADQWYDSNEIAFDDTEPLEDDEPFFVPSEYTDIEVDPEDPPVISEQEAIADATPPGDWASGISFNNSDTSKTTRERTVLYKRDD